MTLKLIALLCLFASSKAHNGYSSDRPDNQFTYDREYQEYQENSDNELHGDEIPGVAGRDYPIFREVPQTSFDCEKQRYPGYYADTEAECQAFHICQTGGRKDSFLCPNGTLFNQERLVCMWWHQVDCSQAPSFYSINEDIVRAMESATKLADDTRSQEDYRYDQPPQRNEYSTPRSENQQPSNKYLEPAKPNYARVDNKYLSPSKQQNDYPAVGGGKYSTTSKLENNRYPGGSRYLAPAKPENRYVEPAGFGTNPLPDVELHAPRYDSYAADRDAYRPKQRVQEPSSVYLPA